MMTEPQPRVVLFNPHDNATANGILIEPNMLVKDYNMDVGVVIRDRDAGSIRCREGYCGGDHWFDVKRSSDENVGMFNGERLLALVKKGAHRVES
jgi:hypothetical protein